MNSSASQVVVMFKGDNKQLNASVADAKSSINSVGKEADNAGKSSEGGFNLGTAALGALKVAALAAVAAISGIAVKGIASGFELAQQIEDATTGLKFMTGSADEANAAIERIRKEAMRTPFDVGNLSKMTQQLTAFTGNADKSIDVLLGMGSAVVASGGDINNLQSAVINLGQAFNNTWTYADYKQLLNASPIFKKITDDAGLTWEAMQELQKSGGNLGDTLSDLLLKWGDQNDVFKETQGNLSQIKASFQESFQSTFYEILKNTGAIEAFKNILGSISKWFSDNSDTITTVFNVIGQAVGGLIEGLTWMYNNAIKPIFEMLAEQLAPFWDKHGDEMLAYCKDVGYVVGVVIGGALAGIIGLIAGIITVGTWLWENVMEPIYDFVHMLLTEPEKAIISIGQAALDFIHNVNHWLGDMWNNVLNFFTGIGVAIGDAVSGAFKAVVNGVLGFLEGIINTAIGGINGVLGLLNALPGVDIGLIGNVNLPRMARGGIVTGPTIAMIGEGGESEAVIPLSKLEQMLGSSPEGENSGKQGATINQFNEINNNVDMAIANRDLARMMRRI